MCCCPGRDTLVEKQEKMSMNIQPGDVVRISHEALLPNYLLGRTGQVIFVKSDGVCDGYDAMVNVRVGNRRRKGCLEPRLQFAGVWKEEVEPIPCM